MCGILGTIPATDAHFFEKALNTLAHRGPDSFGIWHDQAISLGHRRLSILDVSNSGHQPMSYCAGRFQIVFNGEIYNFIEIRRELEAKGHLFRSESDTEVVLASFLEWGEACLNKFNGMWAMGIWDTAKRRLFLSRDRFGKKPLFYAFAGGKFIFASEMKALLPFLPEVRPSSEFKWMAQTIFYETTDRCLVEGIKRFPAGHYGYLRDGRLTVQRYWNVLDHLVTPENKYDSQVEHFRELFIDACRLRMRSDVPIGTALSGGLDSSATISVMAHLSRESENQRGSKDWQHAFVACFPGTPIDESKYAKLVVDNIGINATYIDIDPVKRWNNLKDYLYLFEELYLTSPIPMIAIYEAVKAHGVTVTLDGHGADELFSGYGHLVEALWDAGTDLKAINDILSTYIGTIQGFSQIKPAGKFGTYCRFMIKKALKKALGLGYQSKDKSHPNFGKMDNFTQELYIVFNETILPTLLRNYDRYSMINGVEIRMPFMDHRLVTYLHSLPYSSKIGGGYTKRLVRDALATFMPHEITYRKSKIGFNSPIVDWMQGPLKEWFEDTIHEQAFLECSLIDNPKDLQNQILNITSGQDSLWQNAEQAWIRISPFLWEQSFLKRESFS